jgi:hypothetical protein
MIEEGFREQDLIDAILGRSRILEDYVDEDRCLVVGYFRLSEKVRCPLHIVCDCSNADVLDIVTAYVPEKPWWRLLLGEDKQDERSNERVLFRMQRKAPSKDHRAGV